jgi:hypothetical protein
VSASDAAGSTDPVVDGLRDDLASLDDLAVDEHVAVFERVNASIAHELAQLDEV